MRVFNSRRKREQFLILLVLSVMATVAAYIYLGHYIEMFSRPAEMNSFIRGLGIFGPLAIIGMQFTQILLAPLPPVVPLISGYAFGPFEGTVYSMIGAFFGSALAIYLSRKYVRGIVTYFVRDEVFYKFQDFAESKGILPYVVMFTLPGFPDDALCFIAGLTEIDFKKLVFVATIGRLPGIFALSLTGSSIATSQGLIFMVSAGTLISVSVISVKFEDTIIEIVRDLEQEGSEILESLYLRLLG